MRLSRQHLQVLRYLTSGCLAALANFTLLYCLTELLHVWYLASSLVALAAGLVTSFVLQKFWAFENPYLERVHVQFQKHVLLSLANVGFNTAALYLLVEYLHLWYMWAQFVITAALATINYFVFKHYIFAHRASAPIP